MQIRVSSNKRFTQDELIKFTSSISCTASSNATWNDQYYALLRDNGQIFFDEGTIGWGAFMGQANQIIGGETNNPLYCCGGTALITGDGRARFTTGEKYDLVLIEADLGSSQTSAVWTTKSTLATYTVPAQVPQSIYLESYLTTSTAIQLDPTMAYMMTIFNDSGQGAIRGVGINTSLLLGKGVKTT